MNSTTSSTLLNQYCITVALLSVLLHMYGFFPIKASSNIFSSQTDLPKEILNIKFHEEKLYNGSIGKTVLMVIDGLRLDFVTSENMPYTGGAVERGECCQLTTRVSAPTVTLPRVKAIVSGTVSSFLDVVLNFGTQELAIDNIIHQATAQGKRVVFYGDDTWVRLFPNHFVRSEGTTSFFVNDYTEVDNNVTRHIPKELERNDWDLMVLHYLGLDHIGHIEGPFSHLVGPKLREMDTIIAQIHKYLRTQDRGLLVVTGDHGMKDTGSHGGVSLPEVVVPTVTLGLACPRRNSEEILQVDMAATLSVLWGAAIPADSVGVAALPLLTHLAPAQRLYARLYNAQQLADNYLRNGGSKTQESYRTYEEAQSHHYQWLRNDSTSSTPSYHQVDTLYHAGLLGMSRYLSELLANYHMDALVTALLIVLQVLCVSGMSLAGVNGFSLGSYPLVMSTALSGVLTIVFSICFDRTFMVVLVFVVIFLFNISLLQNHLNVPLSLKKVRVPERPCWEWLLPVGTGLFCVSLFSSSLVEEEHQLWYWLWASCCVLQAPSCPLPWLTLLASHRLLRALNQTGDKWAHLPDLSDWLGRPNNKGLLSTLCAASLLTVVGISPRHVTNWLSRLLQLCIVACIYQFKAASQQVVSIVTLYGQQTSGSGVLEARLCWLLLLALLLAERDIARGWTLAVCLLLRPHNTVLVPALLLTSRVVCSLTDDVTVNTVLHHWLGSVFFFYQGNSNSLASVDISSGYAGLEEYNLVLVAALLFIHTYAMPVLAFLLNTVHIIHRKSSRSWRVELMRSVHMVVFLQMLHLFVCLVVITLQRYHLFVWTVFSPKLLYISAQTFVFAVLVTLTNLYILIF